MSGQKLDLVVNMQALDEKTTEGVGLVFYFCP